ncbi:MAG: hypothetical protein ASARMPREDX12_003484 [Alectoria sarmentosa]|nr:MAG: hypothetical protein ASARMPREDX12_003484 [Alectoria sarmentosa]
MYSAWENNFAMTLAVCASQRFRLLATGVILAFKYAASSISRLFTVLFIKSFDKMRVLPNIIRLCLKTIPAVLPSIVPIELPTVPANETTELPNLPNNFTTNDFTTSNTSLAAAQIFKYRVPHSTIELYITTTNPIDGQILGSTLLRIHEYINDEISRYGDRPLAAKDDPFVWEPSGTSLPPVRALMANNLPVRLMVESVPGEHMTWGVLLIAVEGLYLCLPAVGRDFGAKFDVWDWRDQAQWGSGEMKGVNPVAGGESVDTARMRRSAEDVMP